MKRPLLFIVAAAAAASTAPGLVVAQDFLGNAARSAAQSAAQGLLGRAVSAATSPRRPAQPQTTPSARGGAASTASQTQQPAASALPADFPAPRPINYSPSLSSPLDMQFSQADMDARKAFDEIGRYNCSDCEGGVGYDSWVRHEVSSLWGPSVLENRLGGMPIGEAIRWTGSRTRTQYAITVVGDRGIGQWPCKQLKWTGDRGQQHVERMGLICKPTNNWHTIL